MRIELKDISNENVSNKDISDKNNTEENSSLRTPDHLSEESRMDIENSKLNSYKNQKTIHRLFGIRIGLWVVALGSTFYWIWYSFHLFQLGEYDVHDYASRFRPVFTVCLIISLVALIISLFLRKVSDSIKEIEKFERTRRFVEESKVE